LCAYLEDRPIYVLDEWAADQDSPFKKFFYESLLPDLKGWGECVIIIIRFVQAPAPPIELQAMQMAYSELSSSNRSL